MNFRLFTKRMTLLLNSKLPIRYSKAIRFVESCSHRYCSSGPIFITFANRTGVLEVLPGDTFNPGTFPVGSHFSNASASFL